MTRLLLVLLAVCSCGGSDGGGSDNPAAGCELVENGSGPRGSAPVSSEVVVSGLEVPWGIAFLSADEWLLTERPGRLRRVLGGTLESEPLAFVPIAGTAEGGLLDIALHPDFRENRLFYLYVTVGSEGAAENRVERWKLAQDHRSAALESVVFEGIPAASVHDGGRIAIGPDGMLYVTTGDARDPDSAQDPASLSGKILRLTPDGAPAPDNPFPDSAVFVLGVRNPQGLVIGDDQSLVIADHGPSGELDREGHDEVSVAVAGANLGWPTIYGCEGSAGLVSPMISWQRATPPGGMALYSGERIAEWSGALVVGTLRSEHLHVLHLDEGGTLSRHETYFNGELGRLRTVLMGPDGELYVTTSNCDGRGTCGAAKDAVLRIVPSQE